MSQQLGLFPNGDDLKKAGISQVLANTPLQYRIRFEAVALGFASGTRFTSETVTAKVGQPPHSPNTVGALINQLARSGVIKHTGQWVKATRVNQHSAELKVWVRC